MNAAERLRVSTFERLPRHDHFRIVRARLQGRIGFWWSKDLLSALERKFHWAPLVQRQRQLDDAPISQKLRVGRLVRDDLIGSVASSPPRLGPGLEEDQALVR